MPQCDIAIVAKRAVDSSICVVNTLAADKLKAAAITCGRLIHLCNLIKRDSKPSRRAPDRPAHFALAAVLLVIATKMEITDRLYLAAFGACLGRVLTT